MYYTLCMHRLPGSYEDLLSEHPTIFDDISILTGILPLWILFSIISYRNDRNTSKSLNMYMYLLPSIPVGIWCFCLAFLFIYICIVLDTGFLLDLSVSMGIGSSVLAGFLSGDVAPQLNTIALTVKMINIPLMPLPCTCVHVWKHVHTFKVLMLTVQTYMYIVYVMLHTCTCIWQEINLQMYMYMFILTRHGALFHKILDIVSPAL